MVKEITVLMICVSLGVGFSNPAEANGKEERTLAASRGIRVHYELTKTIYLVAEPIFLRISVENNGTQVECYSVDGLWNLELRNETGALLKRKGGIYSETRLIPVGSEQKSTPCRGGFEELKPGSMERVSSRNLVDYYGEGQGGYDFYLKAGTYTMTARELPSDTISFRVVWPSLSEDSIAVNTLIYATDNAYTILSPAEQRYRFFSDFVEKFPNSVYTPRALRRLLATSTVETPTYDESKKQYYVRYMLTKFPESGFAFRALQVLDPSMVSNDEKTAVASGLRKLKANLEAEDLRRRADELIEKLEK